jgi:hypothetical protein
MSAGAGILLEEFALDRNAARFGLLATLPIIFCISVVSCSALSLSTVLDILILPPSSSVYSSLETCHSCKSLSIINAANTYLCSFSFGPVAQYHENSMYYSAVKPKPNPEIDNNLPHITIQMPVYKESLELTM